ncbi:MAG: pirin family protein [Pseudonocardia sp.]|uniref:pirin family protein n=1 Tax=Pseudonocardia sp. TaxID=60912 RepID=UPI001ACB8B62|nr:pirin family protein [Pseudonocardia sp.]MBN9099420.1 pirin family protein [Pseudonocardia sp.]
MSNTESHAPVEVCRGDATAGPVRQLLPSRAVQLGAGTEVRRLLPTLGRRMIGAWCFVDHYGPDEIAARPGMDVPPHPHIGLQTVSWLLDGEVHHRDSLGSDVLIRPGELGLMTAGSGIAHSEQSPDPHSPVLHGAQLWVALPGADRATEPRFEHHAGLPVVTEPGCRATVLLGELAGARSPGRVHSPLVGLDVTLDPGAHVRLPLEPDFEHAVLTVSGAPDVDGGELAPGSLCYLGSGRRDLAVRARAGGRFLLLGGVPFAEEIVMWWNFVARSGDEVAAARTRWAAGGFGEVPGEPLAAPPLPPAPLVPRGRVR